MSKSKIFTLRLDPAIHEQLVKLAASKGLTPSELARDYVVAGMDAGLLETQKEQLSMLVRMAVGQEMQTVANRLASISAKSAISSGTATFMTMLLFNNALKMDEETIMEYYNDAKKQAYQFVRNIKLDDSDMSEE